MRKGSEAVPKLKRGFSPRRISGRLRMKRPLVTCRTRCLCSFWTLLLGWGVVAGVGNAQTPPPPATPARPALEPKAIDILKAACSRLAAAHTMAFTAVVAYESPSRLGPPLVYTTKSEVTMQRPDKLRVITLGDGPASEFYYDGKIMMAYAPAENLVAIADAPPTIDAALKAAYDSA